MALTHLDAYLFGPERLLAEPETWGSFRTALHRRCPSARQRQTSGRAIPVSRHPASPPPTWKRLPYRWVHLEQDGLAMTRQEASELGRDTVARLRASPMLAVFVHTVWEDRAATVDIHIATGSRCHSLTSWPLAWYLMARNGGRAASLKPVLRKGHMGHLALESVVAEPRSFLDEALAAAAARSAAFAETAALDTLLPHPSVAAIPSARL